MLSFGSVNLWAAEKLDVGNIYRWANSEDYRRLMAGLQRPQSMPELEGWLAEHLRSDREELYSIKTPDAEMVGLLNLSNIDLRGGCAEVGLMVDSEFWGRGYGHDALVAGILHAFEDKRLHRLQADILSINTPSKNLFERLGFRREGVRREAVFLAGRYLDIEMYGLLAQEFQRPDPYPARPETNDVSKDDSGETARAETA